MPAQHLPGGVHPVKRIGMISADGQQRNCGLKPAPSDLTEALEIGRITGVINRVLTCAQNKSSVAAVHVAHHARTPMT